MSDNARAFKVAENVYWVGAIDWSIRDFHGYATNRGTSYNAFLVMADEPILIDTVKKPFADQMFDRISEICDPESIGYVISNHSEMDHSGLLPEVIDRCRPKQVFTSPKGAEALAEHFGFGDDILTVTPDGESLSIAGADFQFVETRMLHWPDSMFSYYKQGKVLFSSDAFGMHLASSERFTDELPWAVIEEEMAKYYANILMPFSKLILKLVDRVKELNLPLELIACDHGPIWRSDFDKIIALYEKWATQAPTDKAVIVYDTMWGSTAKLAQALADGLVDGGVSVRVHPLSGSHRSDVATEVLDAGALLVGAPTLNQNMFPAIADVLTYLKGLQPKNLLGLAFGSYGWASRSAAQISAVLDEMGIEQPIEKMDVKYVPTSEDLTKFRQAGRDLAATLLSKL